MTLDEVYVHDARLCAVHENCETQTLILDVDLPANEWSDKLVPKRIILREVYGYRVDDSPFVGLPAILAIDKLEQADRWTKYRIGTNAGERTLYTSGFSIEDR